MPNQYYFLLTASGEVSRDEVQAEAQPGTPEKFLLVSSLRCLSRFGALVSGTSGLDLCKFHALHVAVAGHRLVKDLLFVAIAIFYDIL